jgi:integrase
MGERYRLTVKEIEASKPDPGGKLVTLSDGGGLLLQVRTGKSKNKDSPERTIRSWVWRYSTGDMTISKAGAAYRRERNMGLGSYPDISLTKARQRADKFRQMVLNGIDPLEQKRDRKQAERDAQAAVRTFDDATKDFLTKFKTNWRSPVHQRQWEQSMRDYASPIIGSLDVRRVTKEDVLRCLGPIWQKIPRTAERVRSRIERVLNYVGRHADNPAKWQGQLEFVLPPRKSDVNNHRALEWPEMPEFMAELRAIDSTRARALELAILTGGRTGEVRMAPWSEFDLDRALWLIPKERYKTEQDQPIPLSAPALALLRSIPKVGERVFPTLADRAMWQMTQKLQPAITVHGFRATFKSWCAVRGYPRETAELCLGHKIGNRVEQAYMRENLIEQRRAVFDAWAEFCAGARNEKDTPIPA